MLITDTRIHAHEKICVKCRRNTNRYKSFANAIIPYIKKPTNINSMNARKNEKIRSNDIQTDILFFNTKKKDFYAKKKLFSGCFFLLKIIKNKNNKKKRNLFFIYRNRKFKDPKK